MLDGLEPWSHHNPVRVVSAPLNSLLELVTQKHVLLVTTQGFVRRGVVDNIHKLLAGKKIVVWDGVKPNPDMDDLDRATVELRAHTIECVIGLGGGSALDAAKILAATIPSTSVRMLSGHFRLGEPAQWARRLPLIAIPTTSGTGAEVTPFATIWDHTEHKKYSLAGDFVYPDTALLDSNLTMTLGKEDTLYPALDTISHALESLWNKHCTPVSRVFAYQSLALSCKALPQVLSNPTNVEQRRNLQVASTLAGMAISQTRTAIAHAISYPLTARFGVPHGLACSFTLSTILKNESRTIGRRSYETAQLEEVLSMLNTFDLKEHLSIYVSKDEILPLTDKMRAKGRSENYLNSLNISIDEIIEYSLWGY